MTPENKDKLKTNLAISYKMASVQATTIVGMLATAVLAMPESMRSEILNHLPVPSWLLPIISWGVIYLARIWPQLGLSKEEAEAKSADPEPTNDKGQP